MRVLRVLLALGLCPPVVSPAKEAAPVPELHALFDSAWQRDLEDDPLAATQYGDRRYNDRLPDLSPAAIERSHRLDQKVLDDLAKIPRGSLPEAEQLNYDLFERKYNDPHRAATRSSPFSTASAIGESLPALQRDRRSSMSFEQCQGLRGLDRTAAAASAR